MRAIVYAGCIIVGLLVLLGVVIVALRRRYVDRRAPDWREPAFTVADLQRLRDSGELSDAEFRRLRRSVLGLEGANRAPLSAGGAGDDEYTADRSADDSDDPDDEETQ